MRKTYEYQLTFGNVDISQIKTDPKSRDEIDRTVRGLQYLYVNEEIREEIFKILEENILPNVSKRTGRKGMDLWKILVLGIFREVCSWDYDKLHQMSNNHLMIRELLGHGRDDWKDTYYYELQTLKDNISLLTPEMLRKINEIVVKAGHMLLGGKKKEELNTNADSFVVKTDIHYPSDISLLYDSARKSIKLTKNFCELNNKSAWRQSEYIIKTIKSGLRHVQKSKHSCKASSKEKIKAEHRKYITRVGQQLDKVSETVEEIRQEQLDNLLQEIMLQEIEKYVKYGRHQIDLIDRRVFCDEKIPHSEKIFSIFEPHTRWISKGKAGVFVEFGLPVTILKDQNGYILDYEIMENTNDVDVAIPLIVRAKEKFPAIKSCSYDKGYWSPSNREAIGNIVEVPVMLKKGRLNKAEQLEQSTKEFIKLRQKHSSVESTINGLDHSGLEKCYDHGIWGFKRCVGLSVLARNIQTLGKDVKEKEDKRSRRKKHKKAA